MKLALTICALVGCASETTGTECKVDYTQAPFTPGTVECGAVAACPVGRCRACQDPGVPGPSFALYCETVGVPAGFECRGTIGCDGPEDCAVGEYCWGFESTQCATAEWPQPGYRVCRGDECVRCE